MKPLIPSHREKKRYLLIEGKELKKNVEGSIKEYLGILGLAKSSPNWIELNGQKGIFSINRSSLDDVRAALLVSRSGIKIFRVSGSLKGLRK